MRRLRIHVSGGFPKKGYRFAGCRSLTEKRKGEDCDESVIDINIETILEII
jgi:hypothetical protein